MVRYHEKLASRMYNVRQIAQETDAQNGVRRKDVYATPTPKHGKKATVCIVLSDARTRSRSIFQCSQLTSFRGAPRRTISPL
jgi:hypothetical protein